jgi:dephospho-CoA kinase
MKTFNQLQEGVYDPNIFKAFFLAGGPGSGKSYVVRKTTGGSGLKTINSDDAFEHLLKKANLSLKMPEDEKDARDVQRKRAKELTKKKQDNYLDGRLGLIIDGTGKDYDKIQKQKAGLEQLGYDCYMIFVNTSVDVALKRNTERPRSVPEPLVIKSWKDVQGNIGKFNNLFKSGMVIVDNNDAGEDIFAGVWKRIRGLLGRKVRNTRADTWIKAELAKKSRK